MDWIRQALTRKVHRKGTRNKEQVIVIEPNETLVYGVKFAIAMTVCLTAVEIAHIVFLGSWNSEVFSAITGLIGIVTGVFIGQKT